MVDSDVDDRRQERLEQVIADLRELGIGALQRCCGRNSVRLSDRGRGALIGANVDQPVQSNTPTRSHGSTSTPRSTNASLPP